MQWTERARFLIDNLDLPGASQVDHARWEHFQLAHLCDDSTFRIELKSRQIAWSFLAASEAVAEAVMDGSSSLFISINFEEAMEKIRYARRMFDNLQIGGLPKLVRDNELSLEFDNGARLTSLPAKPPRGKARMNVYLDEFAHVQHDRDIYTGALPVISKGGRLRVGSSPMGSSGVFWEVYGEGMRAYPGYARKSTPWWEVQSFCLNVREAHVLGLPGVGWWCWDDHGLEEHSDFWQAVSAHDWGQVVPPPPPVLPAHVSSSGKYINYRDAANLNSSSDVGDILLTKADVVGEEGDFWKISGYVAKSVTRIVL